MVRRIVAASALPVLLVCAGAIPAWAHVTVAPESAPKGGTDQQITFRVPNEEQSATTKVQIVFPTDPPLVGVLAQPVPGWTSKVSTQHLSQPIQTDDGPVSDIVSDVTWTADNAASGIQPDDFQAFQVLVGALPDSGDQIVFKAVQTYANGDVVRWVDPVTPGGPEAEHPTPIMNLTSGSGEATTPTTTANGTAATPTGAVKSAQDDADNAKTLAIIGIIVGAVGLIVAVVALVIRRRTPATTQTTAS